MKKMIPVVLASVLAFTACGSNDQEEVTTNDETRENFIALNVDVACNAPSVSLNVDDEEVLNGFFTKHGFDKMNKEEFMTFSEPYFEDESFTQEVARQVSEQGCLPENILNVEG